MPELYRSIQDFSALPAGIGPVSSGLRLHLTGVLRTTFANLEVELRLAAQRI